MAEQHTQQHTQQTQDRAEQRGRPVVLVTGAGRRRGIAAGIALRLAMAGWDVGLTWWTPYDARMPWGEQPSDPASLLADLAAAGARTTGAQVDLSDPAGPATAFEAVQGELGPVTALVLYHCESVDSSILDTTVESFDRHLAVNARATWLLVREHALRFRDADLAPGTGRVVALTSDHTAHNLPYGASKGALERIVVAAAEELGGLGISSNALNPGPVDTGWMDDDVRRSGRAATPLGRLGTPADTADLVEFLLSPRGGWVTGQVLFSNGGFRTHR